jgi:TetR/AcrR family transcriptional regulator, repressor for uid operon
MPKLTPNAQFARREHILDAAERCFIRNGFHATAMHDICNEARVSPGALYIYFSSKEDLIAGLCERETARFTKELAQVSEGSSFLAALQSLAEQYCCNEPIEKVRLHVEIRAEAGRNDLIGETVRRTNRLVRASFVKLLERERERGAVNPRLATDTVVRVMSALGDGLFFNRALDPAADPRPLIPAMMAMVSALLAPVSAKQHSGTDERPAGT